MRNRLFLFTAAILTILTISACRSENTPPAFNGFPVEYGVSETVSRASAAKALAFVFADRHMINAYERTTTFTDTDSNKWYDIFVNAVYNMGIMTGAGDTFMPDEPLTILQAGCLIQYINPYFDMDEITPDIADMPIPRPSWANLLLENLEAAANGDMLGTFGIERADIIPLWLVPGGVISARGILGCAGIDMEAYLDKEVSVLVKENEILAVLETISGEPLVRGAYIVGQTDDILTVFAGGATRTYLYTGGLPEGAGICDMRVRSGEAVHVQPLRNTVSGTVLRIAEGFTELRDIPLIPNAEDLAVYDASGKELHIGGINGIIPGSSVSVALRNGEAAAVIITELLRPQTMRVLLSARGNDGYERGAVSVTCDTPYTVWAGGQAYIYDAGGIFTVSEWENAHLFTLDEPRIHITPDNGGRVQILYENGEAPSYRGFLEIAREGNAYNVINQLPMEEYLYGVISGRITEDYPQEAARALAILTRSYAYNQFFANAFASYGANVDDSIISQAYNAVPENAAAISAADKTRGMCLAHDGSVISGRFFHTSAGVSANAGEVWADSATGAFPAASPPYLTSVKQYTGADYGDLRLEENAEAFFKSLTVGGYDAHSPWFRWTAQITTASLSASINASLEQLRAANPALIQTQAQDGSFVSSPVKSIGVLTDIAVVSRGEGGVIMSMLLTGTNASVLVSGEHNVRTLLKPANTGFGDNYIILRDGEASTNHPIMPSAFFVMDKHYDEQGGLSSITFHGGGYGHGAGMSVSGAAGMAKSGYTYGQILKHFYKHAVIFRAMNGGA